MLQYSLLFHIIPHVEYSFRILFSGISPDSYYSIIVLHEIPKKSGREEERPEC